MYVGRIIATGRTAAGRLFVAYRVSSRSFPNRHAVRIGETVQIRPRLGSADERSSNAYINYECALWNDNFLVAGNGSHTRFIFDRLVGGGSVRDCATAVLFGMDREFDQHETPRIAAVANRRSGELYLASITKSGLACIPIEAEVGSVRYIATYHFPIPDASQCMRLNSERSAADLCLGLIEGGTFLDFTNAVCSVAVVDNGPALDVAVLNLGNPSAP
jgi:IMP cyclohydrolase